MYKERAEAFGVAAVASGTPAAESGLQVDDEIIAVDGIAAQSTIRVGLRARGTPSGWHEVDTVDRS